MSNQKPNPVVEFHNSDNQKKGIYFNDGICNACKYAVLKKEIESIGFKIIEVTSSSQFTYIHGIKL